MIIFVGELKSPWESLRIRPLSPLATFLVRFKAMLL
nr:MAG TPA: hypothetical protein [Caudoviricetes sp.]